MTEDCCILNGQEAAPLVEVVIKVIAIRVGCNRTERALFWASLAPSLFIGADRTVD